jgi:hypothetical protein
MSTPDGWGAATLYAPGHVAGRGSVRTPRPGRRLARAFGRFSTAEIRDRIDTVARLQRAVAGPTRIAVTAAHPGVDSAAVAALLASALAYHRRDRIALLDAAPGPVPLAGRLNLAAEWPLTDLAGCSQSGDFDQIESSFLRTAAGLWVLPGADGRLLDPNIYRSARAVLNQHFAVAVLHAGTAPAHEIVSDIPAHVLVAAATPESFAGVRRLAIGTYGQTQSTGFVAVFVAIGRGPTRELRAESAALAQLDVASVLLPYDPALAHVVDPSHLSERAHGAVLSVAAHALDRAAGRK